MIFVSYSRSDIHQIRPFVDLLSQNHVDYWIDESNIPVGQAFVENLGTALRKADSLVLVDTPASRSSYWVWREIQTASRYRNNGRFHSILRIYAPGCEANDLAQWDTSIPFNEDTHSRVAQFIAARRSSSHGSDHEERFPSVSVHGDTRLGQPSNWIGRQDDLRLLDEWWFGPSLGVWLRGLGGIGKSGLLQTWVTALAYFGYLEPAAVSVLHLSGREILDFREAQSQLMAWISENPTQNRLLVVDGHDEAPSTQEADLLIRGALRSGIRTIVTSRAMCTDFLAREFTNIGLNAMTRKDSLVILDQLCGSSSINDEIAAELGDHPLALTVFTGAVIARGNRPENVLKELRRIKAEDTTSGPDQSLSIRASISESLRNLAPDARMLLERICEFDDAKVERADLMNPLLRELASSGLIQVDRLDSPTQLSMHPLVRSFLRENQGVRPLNVTETTT